MKTIFKFVECKESPGLQVWRPGSAIYHKCHCGQELSYDTPGVETHWEKYEIAAKVRRGQDVYLSLAEKVATNKDLYRVKDWS